MPAWPPARVPGLVAVTALALALLVSALNAGPGAEVRLRGALRVQPQPPQALVHTESPIDVFTVPNVGCVYLPLQASPQRGAGRGPGRHTTAAAPQHLSADPHLFEVAIGAAAEVEGWGLARTMEDMEPLFE